MKILIVDDCPSTRAVLEKHASEWGFNPIIAKSGDEALDQLAADDQIRMLIVDWMMPKMDGPTLIQKVRATDAERSRYIVMLTAKTGDAVVESAFQCGADDYLAKPIDRDELYCRIREGQNILERQDQVGQAIDELRVEAK